jgi:hypothetical protein
MLASPPTLEGHHDFIWLLARAPTTATTPKLYAFDESQKKSPAILQRLIF